MNYLNHLERRLYKSFILDFIDCESEVVYKEHFLSILQGLEGFEFVEAQIMEIY